MFVWIFKLHQFLGANFLPTAQHLPVEMGMTPVCRPCLVLEYQHHCWHYIFLGTRLRKSIKNVYDQTDVCLYVFWENRILTISPTVKITFSLQAAAYQLFYHVTGRKTAGLLHSAGWCCACFPWEENTQPCNDWRSWKLSHPQLPAANCDWTYCWAGSFLHHSEELPLICFVFLSIKVNIQICFWRSSLPCLAENLICANKFIVIHTLIETISTKVITWGIITQYYKDFYIFIINAAMWKLQKTFRVLKIQQKILWIWDACCILRQKLCRRAASLVIKFVQKYFACFILGLFAFQ